MLMWQCELQRDNEHIVGWIEERAAKLNAEVELIADDKKLWRIVKVWNPPLEDHVLKEKQRMDRCAFASLKVK